MPVHERMMATETTFGDDNHGVQIGHYVDLNGRDFGVVPTPLNDSLP